ncbi:sigma-54-dependent transcriptional regulator [Desulfosarcina ovata]|uniref:Sigma-54-dependent Fis family transcriptional regulator n=1 Tax=Desulfosarcina ovata subsp. ovata TaxID=2752305 RepID=A0A5K8AL38_9BACT|nr:sigma 54-interacting transcriptional regulator [Desulfosarcina ovata]BBO93249.1 sigma-54-dependent Fis family transcriptional regulator [Desulfosarcina ovata subsp. ovata]
MTVQPKRVLLVDDEEKLLESIARRMKVLGLEPLTATNGISAIEIAMRNSIDMAIVDLQMPDMNGLVTITKLKEIKPDLKTVLLTGHGNDKVKQATESLNTLYFEKEEMGDFWRFIKGLDTNGKVVVIRPSASNGGTSGASGGGSASSIEIHSQRDFAGAPYPQTSPTTPVDRAGIDTPLRIFGETAVMRELRKGIERVTPLDCPVMLQGENGTGKERIARHIHSRSRHHGQRFLTVDCENLGSDQFVRQLIGYGQNDLYEAIRSQSGMFSAGQVGSLFFDRVEAMPLAMQAQLVGIIDAIDRSKADGGQNTATDIRILAATEIDLNERVIAGKFDPALYDRLTFFKFIIPPLRQRKDDIPLLCSFYLRQFNDEFKKPVESIDPNVIEILSAYPFPGNVSELADIIERAVILADGTTIEKRHLPERFLKTGIDAIALPEDLSTLAQLENQYILKVLDITGGNKSKSAEILGISRAALWRKLKNIKADAAPSPESIPQP